MAQSGCCGGNEAYKGLEGLTVEESGVKWRVSVQTCIGSVLIEPDTQLRKEVRTMFLGTHAPRLDEKGRLVFPAKFREALAAGLVLTRGQDRSVVVWPAAEFTAYADRLSEASRSDANVRSYLRVLFSGAFDETPDKQGRVTLPQTLRDYAGLDRDVVVVGNGTTCEIWDAAAWSTYLSSNEERFSDLSTEVIPGVL